MRYSLLFLLILFLPLGVTGQVFQEVTFQQRNNDHKNTLVAGQRIRVYTVGTDGYLKSVKGKLKEVRNDSIFLIKKGETLGIPLVLVQKIRYRPEIARKFMLTSFLVGMGLLLLFLILGIAWLSSGLNGSGKSSSGNYLAVIAGMGYVLIFLAPIVGLFSKKVIDKPATKSNMEVFMSTPPKQVP